MPAHMLGASRPVYAIAINADTADVNVQSSAGSPAIAGDYVVTIATGIVVYLSAGAAALRTGTFPSGSTCKIINKGTICGSGGSGNVGGGGGFPNAGGNGSAAGDAIKIDGTDSLSIDNGSGNIFGGGGGGGGGTSDSTGLITCDGGGGGGGRGRVASSGGAGGTGDAVVGSAGLAGSFSTAGTGGAGGHATGDGGAGGDGGDWGNTGQRGSLGTQGAGTRSLGGAAGFAVRIGTGSVAFTAGNNSSQVKGSVA